MIEKLKAVCGPARLFKMLVLLSDKHSSLTLDNMLFAIYRTIEAGFTKEKINKEIDAIIKDYEDNKG
jgi:hypothetical protein